MKIFLIAEVFILVFALVLAVLRSLPGPVFFPIRALAIAYADFFRGVPTILVIALLGFGAPALAIEGSRRRRPSGGSSRSSSSIRPTSPRSTGPESSRCTRARRRRRARSGYRSQALTAVVLPQAVRRVIPPLLNDFIGLQKDTALVGILGSVEAFKQAQIEVSADFNFTYYLVAATLFVAITIPLARFTDWLVARDRRRRVAGGIA